MRLLKSSVYVYMGIMDSKFAFRDIRDDSMLLVVKCKYLDIENDNVIFFENSPDHPSIQYSIGTSKRILSDKNQFTNLGFGISLNSEVEGASSLLHLTL
jgi:hypothetical protein